MLARHILRGGFLSIYVDKLGFSPLLIGTLFQIMQLPVLLAPFAARYMDRHGCKRPLITSFLICPIALIPFVLAPQLGDRFGEWAMFAGVFFGLTAFSGIERWGQAGWMPLLRRNLPEDRSTGCVGHINAYSFFTATLILLGASLLINADTPMSRFQLIFAFIVFGLAVRGLFLLRMADVTPHPGAKQEILWTSLMGAWRNVPFRRLCTFIVMIWFARGVTVPFQPLFLKALGFGDQTAFLVTVPFALLTYALTARKWGAMVDKSGSRAAYSIAGPGVALCFLLLLTPSEAAFFDGILFCLWFGLSLIFWGGFDAANLFRLFKIVPEKNASFYMSLHGLCMIGASSAGSFAAGLLIAILRVFVPATGSATRFECRFLFATAAVIVLVGTLYSRTLRNLKEVSAPGLIVAGWSSLLGRFSRRPNRPPGRKDVDANTDCDEE
jgi:MFS family permease